MFSLLSPQPYAVYQRHFDSLGEQYADREGGPARGSGKVRFAGRADPGDVLELLVTTNTFPRLPVGPHLRFRPDDNGVFSFDQTLPAGGWYLASLARGEETITTGPFGVGEVYLVSGQSYVGNYHDARLSVTEPQGRVVAYNPLRKYWRVAHDPQPCVDFPDDGERYWAFASRKHAGNTMSQRFDGGSVWPLVGDMLVGVLGVPVAFANVSYGGALLTEWDTEAGPLYIALERLAEEIGSFRAVLWAQGESDIARETDTADWLARLLAVKSTLAAKLGAAPDWLIAKSTHHPLYYRRAELEAAMRGAIDGLWRGDPEVFPGPDTDWLGGDENRGQLASACHFTAEGQRRAAWLWFHALLAHLQARHP